MRTGISVKCMFTGLILLLSVHILIHAQVIPKKIKFEYLSLEDGLISNDVTCFAKDAKGFLWIGTANGLSRYDGYEFRSYTNDPDNPESLTGDMISSILLDSRNRLWITTLRNGYNLYNPEKDCFIQRKFPGQFGYNLVRTIFEDSRGRLLLGTLGSGILLINPDSTDFKVIDRHNTEDFHSNFVNGIAEDSKGNIWLSHINGSVTRLNPELSEAKTYFYNVNPDNNLFHPLRGSLICFRDTLWITNFPDGLVRFDIAGESFYKYPLNKNGNGLYGNDPVGVIPYSGDYLWVGIDHGGLNLINKKTHKTFYYLNNPADPRSLANNQVNSIFKDNTGIYWIGNYKAGISYFNPRHAAFSNYSEDGTSRGLSGSSVTCLLEDKDQNIWIGLDGGGLNKLDPRTGYITHYRHDQENTNSLSSDIISSIYQDSQGIIWVGTFSKGINAFDPVTGKVTRYGPEESGYRRTYASVIEDITEDRKGNLWISTLNACILMKLKGERSFKPITQLAGKDLVSLVVRDIIEDSKNRIWIGFDDFGIFCYEPDKNNIISLSDDDKLLSRNINFIFEDRKNQIWIGTPIGLFIFNDKEKKFSKVTIQGVTPPVSYHTMVEDNQQNYWIGSNKGIIKFNPEGNYVRIYDYSDGLPGNEYNRKAALVSSDGTFYFGGTKGLTTFNPDGIGGLGEPPPVRITDFYLKNKLVDLRTPGSPLKKDISETDLIKLTHDQNHIGFRFAALSFIHTEKNFYECYLDPLEKEYNNIGHQRIVSYANLSPGEYTFHVRGSNRDLVWNEEERSIKIIITPPFWKTLWFRTSLAIFIVALVFFIYQLRIMSMKTQNLRLEKLVGDQTKQLRDQNQLLHEHAEKLNETNIVLEERQQRIEEQSEELLSQAEELSKTNNTLVTLNATKDKFFSIIAHDLKNPFTSILGFCEILKMRYNHYDDTKKLHLIGVIEQSAQSVYKLLENLLQWARSQTGNMKFAPETFAFYEIIQSIIPLVNNSMNEKELTLEHNITPDITVFADKNMIYTVVRNLVTNAIKFTEKGKISIGAEDLGDEVRFTVKDNGVGIKENMVAKIFEVEKSKSTEGTRGETGTGLGLIICREFIEKNNGKIGVESKEGEGSTFYFILPKKAAGS